MPDSARREAEDGGKQAGVIGWEVNMPRWPEEDTKRRTRTHAHTAHLSALTNFLITNGPEMRLSSLSCLVGSHRWTGFLVPACDTTRDLFVSAC
jgi:hypothetical protein